MTQNNQHNKQLERIEFLNNNLFYFIFHMKLILQEAIILNYVLSSFALIHIHSNKQNVDQYISHAKNKAK